jgi:hypothetical protein
MLISITIFDLLEQTSVTPAAAGGQYLGDIVQRLDTASSAA